MNKNYVKYAVAALCVVLCVASFGCKKQRVFVPVTGTLTLDGAPVEGATVSFLPVNSDEGATSASGITDASGAFKLSSGADEGCSPGEYKVVATKVPCEFVADPKSPMGGRNVFGKNELPMNYGDPAQSGLTATVKKKMDPVVLDLKN